MVFFAHVCHWWGWSGWWMVLSKVSVPGRRVTLDYGPYVDVSAIQA